MLYYTKLERFVRDKYVSLFISYKENEVLRIQSQVMFSQHLIFFISYEWAQSERLGWKGLKACQGQTRPFVSYKESEIL